MGKKDEKITLQSIMPDLLLDLGTAKDTAAGAGLNHLLRDVEKHLVEAGTSSRDVQKFVLAVLKQVSRDSGIPVKDVFDISREHLNAFYAIASNLYKIGKYKEAANMFQLLIMLNHFDFNYLFGMAACMQMQKQFFRAATTYVLAATLDPSQVWPYFHAAECYMEMGDPTSACASLGLAVEVAGDTAKFSSIKKKCAMARQRLLHKMRSLQMGDTI